LNVAGKAISNENITKLKNHTCFLEKLFLINLYIMEYITTTKGICPMVRYTIYPESLYPKFKLSGIQNPIPIEFLITLMFSENTVLSPKYLGMKPLILLLKIIKYLLSRSGNEKAKMKKKITIKANIKTGFPLIKEKSIIIITIPYTRLEFDDKNTVKINIEIQ